MGADIFAAMWQGLMDWLPDWPVVMEWLPDAKVGVFEIRDFVNLAIAVIGIFLTVLAYRISKKQDRILQQQAERRANVVVARDALGVFNAADSSRYGLHIHNMGSRTVDDCNWAIYFLEDCNDKVVLRISDGKMHELSTSLEPAGTADPQMFRQMSGRLTVPVRPGRSHRLGEVVIMHGAEKDLTLLWSVDCEDGIFPEPKGVGEVVVTYDFDDLKGA